MGKGIERIGKGEEVALIKRRGKEKGTARVMAV